MPDLLVKLYELPPLAPALDAQAEQGIRIFRPIAPNKAVVVDWVRDKFNPFWASETDVALTRIPVSCFIAADGQTIVGFACYDAAQRNFFGPTGVLPTYRGRAIGTALLLVCLHAIREQGYGYAIIGAAGPVEFYERAVGAIVIPGSKPGIYRDMLSPEGS